MSTNIHRTIESFTVGGPHRDLEVVSVDQPYHEYDSVFMCTHGDCGGALGYSPKESSGLPGYTLYRRQDAERIAACYNALAGYNPDALGIAIGALQSIANGNETGLLATELAQSALKALKDPSPRKSVTEVLSDRIRLALSKLKSMKGHPKTAQHEIRYALMGYGAGEHDGHYVEGI